MIAGAVKSWFLYNKSDLSLDTAADAAVSADWLTTQWGECWFEIKLLENEHMCHLSIEKTTMISGSGSEIPHKNFTES